MARGYLQGGGDSNFDIVFSESVSLYWTLLNDVTKQS